MADPLNDDELYGRRAAGRRRMAFQREPESISPRGMFDHLEPEGKRKFLTAALVAFAGRGYHATTTRDISTLIGASPAGLYTYYSTKSDVLFEMSLIAHQYALGMMADAVVGDDDPVTRMARLVRASVAYHAEEHVAASVVNQNFDALDIGRLAIILRLRRDATAVVQQLIQDGIDAKAYEVEHLPSATTAVLRMVDVSNWYNERGLLTPEELADKYVGLVQRMLGATSSVTCADSDVSGG